MSDTSGYDTTDNGATYDTSYDSSLEITTSYDTTGAAPVVDPAAYLATDTSFEQTGSYSYDSTDWSAVAAVSEAYTDVYQSGTEMADSLWQASVEAYLDGDSAAAYDLNQASLAAAAGADVAWDSANSAWTDLDQTTVVDTYTTTGYETTPVDTTGYEAAPVDTTGYDTTGYTTAAYEAPVDTSWSAAPADTSATEEY